MCFFLILVDFGSEKNFKMQNLDSRPIGFKLGVIVAVDWIWRFLMLPFLFLVTAEVDKWF